jgi:hypothetical protein
MNVAVEVLLGVAAPVAIAGATWALIRWTYTRSPASLTRVMLAAFAVKMVLFGAYVVAVFTLLPVRPVPFMAGFVSAFILLYLLQALSLQRLFAKDARA